MIRSILYAIIIVCALLSQSFAQTLTTTTGCVIAGSSSPTVGFGINANVFANETFSSGVIPPKGNIDWFKRIGDVNGYNVIKQDNATVTSINNLLTNPTYNGSYGVRLETGVSSLALGTVASKLYNIQNDAIWARDNFGGSGYSDTTMYAISSKNGQDPFLWGPGTGNVLGKNDLIDIAGYMFREIDSLPTTSTKKSNLWFAGLINRAEPGGSAYMDFEFYVRDVAYNKTTQSFNTAGPDMGHTGFRFDATGNITQLGDILFNLSLSGGGTVPNVELRLWVKYTDYLSLKLNPQNLPFNFGDNFDGAGANAAFGYASAKPKAGVSAQICAFVNAAGQLTPVPLWGTKNTKNNTYSSATYPEYSVTEMGMNLTSFGLDHYLIAGYDKCKFPWRTFMVKTRSSEAFTAALKDFTGPFAWGIPEVSIGTSSASLSCTNTTALLTANPVRADVTYAWSTSNGNIVSGASSSTVTVNKPGTYQLTMYLPTGCPVVSPAYVVSGDPGQIAISAATLSPTPSCNGVGGSINLTVTGGTSPYGYSWSNGSVVKDPSGLAPGTYSVTITDSKGCSFGSSTATISDASYSLAATTTNIDCFGGLTGNIYLSPSGGTAPYTYSWSNGKKTQNLLNVGEGTYNVTVTSADGCAKTSSYTLTQPSAGLSATIAKTDDLIAGASGSGTATVTITGGSTAYTYAWTGTGVGTSTSSSISSLTYGTYSVVVTDSKGCTTSKSIIIYEPETCNDDIDNDGDGLTDCADPDCNPSLPDFTGDQQPCILTDVTYTVTSSDPTLTYSWTYPTNTTAVSSTATSTTIQWTSTVAGQVCLTATKAGCSTGQSCKTVTPQAKPIAPTTITKQN